MNQLKQLSGLISRMADGRISGSRKTIYPWELAINGVPATSEAYLEFIKQVKVFHLFAPSRLITEEEAKLFEQAAIEGGVALSNRLRFTVHRLGAIVRWAVTP